MANSSILTWAWLAVYLLPVIPAFYLNKNFRKSHFDCKSYRWGYYLAFLLLMFAVYVSLWNLVLAAEFGSVTEVVSIIIFSFIVVILPACIFSFFIIKRTRWGFISATIILTLFSWGEWMVLSNYDLSHSHNGALISSFGKAAEVGLNAEIDATNNVAQELHCFSIATAVQGDLQLSNQYLYFDRATEDAGWDIGRFLGTIVFPIGNFIYIWRRRREFNKEIVLHQTSRDPKHVMSSQNESSQMRTELEEKKPTQSSLNINPEIEASKPFQLAESKMTTNKNWFNTIWRRIAAFIFFPFFLLALFAVYELIFDRGEYPMLDSSLAEYILGICAIAYAVLRGFLWILSGEPVPLYFKKKIFET